MPRTILPAVLPSALWALSVLLALPLGMSYASTAARAEGGTSIASAPSVAYGQQEFGSLPSIGKDCEYSSSWWTVPVLAGDRLSIDWEAQDGQVRMKLFPPGTTDFNFSQASQEDSELNENDKAELAYTASQAGSMPLQFDTYLCSTQPAPGPYSFTAYVVHALRLFLPRRGRLPLGGSLAVGVHTPVGEPITEPNLQVTLEVKVRGHWYTIGRATPINGTATVPFRLSVRLRHQHVSLRAVAHGSAYQAAGSASVRVKVG